MKLTFHVPVQQYGFLEIEGDEGNLEEMEDIYNKYAENPIKFRKGDFREYETFTGETVLYDDAQHLYTDKEGNKLVSGSEFSKRHQKPFDSELMSGVVSKKYDVPQDKILDMWKRNSEISTTFGTSLHLAMEQWFLNNKNGTEKGYHLPKPSFLRRAVETFPLKEATVIPEAFVSDVKNGMVGQVDGLVERIEENENGESMFIYDIIDYKSDNDVKKNIKHHAIQLNFYRQILENAGFNVGKLSIWNYAMGEKKEEWTEYPIDRVEIEM